MRNLRVLAAAAVAVLGAATLVVARAPAPERASKPSGPAWTEVAWPFPADPWAPGRAFRCIAMDCGAEITVYLRAKVGLCGDCTTGVDDDEHLDRVGDVFLVGGDSTAAGPGEPLTVHHMNGRRRVYSVAGRGLSATSVLSVAFNDRCDVIVATAAIGGSAGAAAQEAAVLDFLKGDVVLHWAEKTLGL